GTKLCGNINVLLLKGPRTTKSQLLKFIEKVAPIAIYTSGTKLYSNINVLLLKGPGTTKL
ncbi:hypothetical protein K432DRAFT_313763, partial [Lepidopterella palustris CBS 459.81]